MTERAEEAPANEAPPESVEAASRETAGEDAAVGGPRSDGADSWRLSRNNVLILVGVIVALSAGAFLVRDFLSLPSNDVVVGDCIDEPPNLELVATLQHRPCSAPHDAEVIFVGDVEGPPWDYPGEEAFTSYMLDNCVPAFGTYTGVDFQLAMDLDLAWIYPSERSWVRNDHEVICYAYRIDGSKLTGSIRAGG